MTDMPFNEIVRPNAALSATLAVVAWLCAVGSAWADLFPRAGEHSGYPLPPVGTEVEYTGDYSFVVTALHPESAGVTVVSENPEYGTERITYAFGIEWYGWALLEDGDVIDRSLYLFDRTVVADAWPLTPGFQGEYGTIEVLLEDDYDPINVIAATLEVLEAERLETPLGELPATMVRLTLDLGRDDTGAQSTNVYTRWFHPDFGLPLKMEDTYYYGTDEPDAYVFDLVSVSFPED